MSKSTPIKKLNFNESETVEFKTSLSEIDQILETVSAFSNTNGGVIYIGVTDNGTISGVTIGKGTLEVLANEIKLNTDPRVFPNIETDEIESQTIIKVSVQEYPIKPVWSKEKVFLRVGKTNQRASAEKIREMIAKNTPFHWDRQVLTEHNLSDISEEDVKSFIHLSNEERNSILETGRNIKSQLDRLNLLHNDKLTNAAILLFGKTPQTIYPRSIVKCAKFTGNEAIDFIDMQDIKGTLISLVPEVLNFIRKHINVSINISGKAQREEIWEYPKEALREAVINAICHRNYEDTGNVQIRIFDNRLEIWNPGTLPEGITIDSLKVDHRSRPRNELIARCFYLIKYIEQWGTGTNRIINSCKEAGLQEPLFEVKDNDFIVTFYRGTERAKVADMPFKLNDTQKKLIRYIQKHKKAKTSDLQKHLDISIQLVRRYLSDLSSILIWSGKTKTDPTGEYSLKPDIDVGIFLNDE
jgi:ATP-dependent DNA helicase RecG